MGRLVVANSFLDSEENERRYTVGEYYSPTKTNPARTEYLKRTGYLQEQPEEEKEHGTDRKSKSGKQDKDQ